MKIKFKITSSIMIVSLLTSPITVLLYKNNLIAKAETNNNLNYSKVYTEKKDKNLNSTIVHIEEKDNNIDPDDEYTDEKVNSNLIINESEEINNDVNNNEIKPPEQNKSVYGEDRSIGQILELAAKILEIGVSLDDAYFKAEREAWKTVTNKYNGWVSLNTNGKTLWFYKVNGNYKKGWHWDSYYNGWYYFYNVEFYAGDPTLSKHRWNTGVMYDADYNNRWLKLNNKWYEFQSGGKLIQHSGWRKYNNKWLYHLPGDYGAIANQGRYIDGKWYNFDSNGYWV